jgi:NADH dehydrogenase FAD-containing subunit
MNASQGPARPRVVIVGAGMAGLATVRALARAPVTVQLIDTHNYTAFPPLLFQVATCFISPAEVARPVRALLRRGQVPVHDAGSAERGRQLERPVTEVPAGILVRQLVVS